jgi:hypothetical protein
MSDEPKKPSQGKGLSRTSMPVTLFTFVVLAAYQGGHYRPAQQPSPKPITLATLVDVMEAREKLADSVTVRWTKTVHYVPGGHFAKQSEFTYPCEMLLKGASMRYVGKAFLMTGGVSLIEYVTSYDGNESRVLRGRKPPQGTIREEKRNIAADNTQLMAFMLYFRPLAEPYDALRRKTLKLLDERKTIDGHECVVVDDGRTRVYLDCDRDFVPVAFQRYVQPGWKTAGSERPGFVYLDGSIEYYRKQGGIRWLPKAFQLTMHGNRPDANDRTRGDQVQTEIGASLKDSDFSLIFEPGTVVWDARTSEQYRILSDGSKEPIERQGRRRSPPK